MIIKNRHWLLSVLCTTALLAPLGHAFAQTSKVPSYVSALLPQGTPMGSSMTFSFHKHQFALVTTGTTPQNTHPWIVVGERENAKWTPIFATDTLPAYAASQFVVGPSSPSQQAVAVSFIIDAATGIETNVYTLLVTDHHAKTVSILPTVINGDIIKGTTKKSIVINALNLQVKEYFHHNQFVATFTPLTTLLDDSATNHVPFVLDASTTVTGGTVRLLGPSTITLKVGQSISFVPLNKAGQNQMLGAKPSLGSNQGISVYTNGGAKSPVSFYQAAQVMTNSYHFSSPGTYEFAIVPKGYTAMNPNHQVALLHVHVTH